MVAVVGIVCRQNIRIEVRYRNRPNENKLVLYKPLLKVYQSVKMGVHKYQDKALRF